MCFTKLGLAKTKQTTTDIFDILESRNIEIAIIKNFTQKVATII